MSSTADDPMLSVTLHVSSYHEAVVRLDERRRISRAAKAHTVTEGGDLVALQRALDDPKARRACSLFVGFLTSLFDAETAPDVLPFVSLEDIWIGKGECA